MAVAFLCLFGECTTVCDVKMTASKNLVRSNISHKRPLPAELSLNSGAETGRRESERPTFRGWSGDSILVPLDSPIDNFQGL